MTPSDAVNEAIAQVSTTRRAQPYRFIHKALRRLMTRTLQRAGSLDPDRPAERAALVAEVEQLLAVCCDHLAHENRYFHAPLRQRAPRAVEAFDDEHQEHLDTIADLRRQLMALRDAQPQADAQGLAYALYLGLSRFVGENLEHMAEEETLLTRTLWQHFSDAEIEGLEARLRATLSPQESDFYLAAMADALNEGELRGLLARTRDAAGADALAAVSMPVQRTLEPARWARLAADLGLAVA